MTSSKPIAWIFVLFIVAVSGCGGGQVELNSKRITENIIRTPREDVELVLAQFLNAKTEADYNDAIKKTAELGLDSFDWYFFWNQMTEKSIFETLPSSNVKQSLLSLQSGTCKSEDVRAYARFILKVGSHENLAWSYLVTPLRKCAHVSLEFDLIVQAVQRVSDPNVLLAIVADEFRKSRSRDWKTIVQLRSEMEWMNAIDHELALSNANKDVLLTINELFIQSRSALASLFFKKIISPSSFEVQVLNEAVDRLGWTFVLDVLSQASAKFFDGFTTVHSNALGDFVVTQFSKIDNFPENLNLAWNEMLTVSSILEKLGMRLKLSDRLLLHERLLRKFEAILRADASIAEQFLHGRDRVRIEAAWLQYRLGLSTEETAILDPVSESALGEKILRLRLMAHLAQDPLKKASLIETLCKIYEDNGIAGIVISSLDVQASISKLKQPGCHTIQSAQTSANTPATISMLDDHFQQNFDSVIFAPEANLLLNAKTVDLSFIDVSARFQHSPVTDQDDAKRLKNIRDIDALLIPIVSCVRVERQEPDSTLPIGNHCWIVQYAQQTARSGKIADFDLQTGASAGQLEINFSGEEITPFSFLAIGGKGQSDERTDGRLSAVKIKEYKLQDWIKRLNALAAAKGTLKYYLVEAPPVGQIVQFLRAGTKIIPNDTVTDLNVDAIQNGHIFINVSYTLKDEGVLETSDLEKFDVLCSGIPDREDCFRQKIEYGFGRYLRSLLMKNQFNLSQVLSGFEYEYEVPAFSPDKNNVRFGLRGADGALRINGVQK